MRILVSSCIVVVVGLVSWGLLNSFFQRANATQNALEEADVEQSRDEMSQVMNWTKTAVPLNKWGRTIAFSQETRAITGEQTFLVSLDNGRVWKQLSAGLGSHLATFDGGSIYRNVDKLGRTLSASLGTAQFCSPESAVITPAGRLYAKTGCEHITQIWSVPLKNQSDRWNVVSFTYEADASEGVYGPGHNLLLAGDRLLIDATLPDGPALLTTDDEGVTWRPVWQGSDNETDITGLSFIDEHIGWMLQGDSTLSKTTDGGRTWSYVSELSAVSTKRGYALEFVNSQKGFIVGFGGVILSSDDGGTTWQQQSTPTTNYLYRVAAADTKRAWVVGEKGTLLQTSDGGAHWQKVDLGIKDDIRCGLTVHDGIAWILSDSTLFRSQ